MWQWSSPNPAKRNENQVSRFLLDRFQEVERRMYDQKVALGTRASSGIGAVYADRLARRRYGVVLVARRLDGLPSVARALRSTYGESTNRWRRT
jgi:hypothetical protein